MHIEEQMTFSRSHFINSFSDTWSRQKRKPIWTCFCLSICIAPALFCLLPKLCILLGLACSSQVLTKKLRGSSYLPFSTVLNIAIPWENWVASSLPASPFSKAWCGVNIHLLVLSWQPAKVLGIYTFTKRVALEEMENKPRKQQGYSTVSHFNIVHYDCHLAAVR